MTKSVQSQTVDASVGRQSRIMARTIVAAICLRPVALFLSAAALFAASSNASAAAYTFTGVGIR